MPVPSFFQRKPKAASPPGPGDDSAAVQQARLRARRRLIGAAMLLLIGIVVFPLLFETQPRPLPADIPIEGPQSQGTVRTAPLQPLPSPALTELPAATATASAPPAETGARPVAVAPPATRPADPAPAAPGPKPASNLDGKPDPKPDSKPDSRPTEATPDAKPVARADPAPAPPTPPRPDAPGAVAAVPPTALPGAAASSPRDARFVVQVGAYTDLNALLAVRQKVEKLGLKTYTQTVETSAGKRTRVRVGPYPTRQEAEGASARLKDAGLPGNVLGL